MSRGAYTAAPSATSISRRSVEGVLREPRRSQPRQAAVQEVFTASNARSAGVEGFRPPVCYKSLLDMTTQPPSRPGGVSIVGLAAALLSISALALLAIPGFFARAEVSLDNATVLLAADLRATQDAAAINECELRVLFFADGSGYSVVDANDQLIAHPAGIGDFVRSYSRDGVFESVRIVSTDLGPEDWITFDAHGFARSVGSVVLGLDDERRTLRVQAASGLVRIEGLGRPWPHDER